MTPTKRAAVDALELALVAALDEAQALARAGIRAATPVQARTWRERHAAIVIVREAISTDAGRGRNDRTRAVVERLQAIDNPLLPKEGPSD
jgi:hypothetical protein